MVAADEIDLEPPPGQLDQEVVQQGHRLRRGHRFVVYIPGDKHPLGVLILYNAYNFFQNILLVFQHGIFVDPLSQVQVGQMDEFHTSSLPRWMVWASTWAARREPASLGW